MSFCVSSCGSRAVVLFFVLALTTVIAESDCGEGDVACLEKKPFLGTLDRTVAKTKGNGGTRKLLVGPHSPKRNDISVPTSLANRRSLLQAQCSDTDTSPEAVVRCTNAVREDPDAHEFSCGSGWGSQYPNRGPLSMDNSLRNAAQGHSESQVRSNIFSHTGIDGSNSRQRARRAGYQGSDVTENIAQGYLSAKEAVYGLFCSPGHRENMMTCNANNIGVGVAGSGFRTHYTQLFGCSSGSRCNCNGGANGNEPSSRNEEDRFSQPRQNPQPSSSNSGPDFGFTQSQNNNANDDDDFYSYTSYEPSTPQQWQYFSGDSQGRQTHRYYYTPSPYGGSGNGYSNFYSGRNDFFGKK